MRTKLDKLNTGLVAVNCDVIALCETWLDDGISDAELGFGSYNVFRLDRDPSNSDKRRGGGVLLAVRREYTVSLIRPLYNDVEQVFVALKLKRRPPIIMGCTYIPPSSSAVVYQHHSEEIETLTSNYPNADFLFMGDYNLPGISWSDMGRGCSGIGQVSRGSNVVLDVCIVANLRQVNTVLNVNNVILDLILTQMTGVFVNGSADPLLPVYTHHPHLISASLRVVLFCRDVSAFLPRPFPCEVLRMPLISLIVVFLSSTYELCIFVITLICKILY
jgi:hypothetical protein